MINLFIPYYIDKAIERQSEIIACLLKNKMNKSIDRIYIVSEDPDADVFRYDKNGNTKFILLQERPTYSTMFDIINSITGPDDWNVLINSDIYTDETIEILSQYTHKDFIALARWDVDKNCNAKLLDRWDAQDAWAFKGKSKEIKNCDFFQGKAGCDNAIADRAEKAGYRLQNPAKSIKIYHLHNSGVRNYNPREMVPYPHKQITPHK